ncbi:MAG TPA: hypothetical protein VMU94_25795 [Streptosporangiaceae bacterium]|nr:hypothetical protein [Streptosporangiaceae bacterium]
MPKSNVTWLRPPDPAIYTDAAALNDIHALLTATTSGGSAEVLADVGLILARSGRPAVRARHIGVRVTETAAGWPAAHVDAEDTTVIVAQDPASASLLIEITTTAPGESDGLTVTLDGRCLQHPRPPDGHAA